MLAFKIFFLFLFFVSKYIECSDSEERLIGWQGETYLPKTKQIQQIHNNEWIELLSWKPRAFLYHNFISSQDADHLIVLASKRMERSQVVPDKDEAEVDSGRTSYNFFIPKYYDKTVKKVEQKMANWTGFPAQNQEPIQILRYAFGQEYQAHYDEFNRTATALIYLTDVEEGGETAFPNSNQWVNEERQIEYQHSFSFCAKDSLAVKPKKGDALLFYSIQPDGVTPDPNALHAGCPVLKGIKWTATIWMHPIQDRPDEEEIEPIVDIGLCYDEDQNFCNKIMKSDCNGKNKDYSNWMCPKKCGICTPCQPGDKKCIKRNREKNGFLYLDDELELLGIKIAY